jgi:alkaline phosphatase D
VPGCQVWDARSAELEGALFNTRPKASPVMIWEFVAGPINAGTLGPEPGELDLTFGPEIKFVSVPQGIKQNRWPFDGLQFYGIGRIDGDTQLLTMSLHDVEGDRLYKIDLEPQV